MGGGRGCTVFVEEGVQITGGGGGEGVYYVEEGYHSVRPMTFNLITFDLFIFGNYMYVQIIADLSASDECSGCKCTTIRNRQMYGYLSAISAIRVPFHNVRESQQRVDPEGSVMRRLLRILNRHSKKTSAFVAH